MLNNSRHNSTRAFNVEFLGGPFDGMQVNVPELEDGLAMPISENTLLKACGAPEERPSRPSSVAFYQLVHQCGRWGYRHIGSTSAHQADLEGWLV